MAELCRSIRRNNSAFVMAIALGCDEKLGVPARVHQRIGLLHHKVRGRACLDRPIHAGLKRRPENPDQGLALKVNNVSPSIV